MHVVSAAIVLVLLTIHAFADPEDPGKMCITEPLAHEYVNNFISLMNGGEFNANLAKAITHPGVIDASGSVVSITTNDMNQESARH